MRTSPGEADADCPRCLGGSVEILSIKCSDNALELFWNCSRRRLLDEEGQKEMEWIVVTMRDDEVGLGSPP